MDTKSKANFINSVAGGQKIPCPKCNALNDADSRFCMTCGTPIGQTKKTVEEVEPNIFAEGLPAWDVLPPQVMVRRKRR